MNRETGADGKPAPGGASLALREALGVYARKQEEIALVVLDRLMPGLSGGETFDRLREINPEVRVLLSRGYGIEGQAQQVLNRGGNGFLRNPFDFECLSGEMKRMPGSRERHRAPGSRGALHVFFKTFRPVLPSPATDACPAHSLDAGDQIPYSSSAFPETRDASPDVRRVRKGNGTFRRSLHHERDKHPSAHRLHP